MHNLLRRQLKRYFTSVEALAPDLQPFIAAVDAAYTQADVDRTMLERSFELTSNELTQANSNLRGAVLSLHEAQRQLEVRVHERTSELAHANDALARKIAEYERAEEALRRSEERFAKAFQANPLAMLMVRLKTGALVDVNESALALFGSTRVDLVGEDVRSARLSQYVPSMLLAAVQERRSVREQEVVIIAAPGTEHRVLVSAEVIDLHWEPSALFMFRDVTQARLLEAQLRQAQKMESIGRLAGGVAHDFNNVLTIIFGHTDVLFSAPMDDEMRESVEEVRKAAESAASLTRQLLAFSRKQLLTPEVFDLTEHVVSIRKLLARFLSENTELTWLLEPDAGAIRADVGQVDQILFNLVVNARDAMPSGGRLTISTSRYEATAGVDRIDMPSGEYVALTVTDTGLGMKPHVKAQIFEPFFTTKELGRGTGLGLAMVYGIVKQSDGYIDVISAEGAGTTFRVLFPRIQITSGEPARGAAPAATGSVGVILIAEDQDGVRAVARECLRRSGYTVIEAVDGQDALEKSGSLPLIDLLLTDIVMPRMNGQTLAARLTARRPALRVLYMTGYTDDADLIHAIRESRSPVLQKPFNAATLLQTVRDILKPSEPC